jgi:hypothetical protein
LGKESILAAAEVEEPGDLVKHRHDEAQALLLLELLAQVLNFVLEALSGVLLRLNNDLFARSGRPLVSPHKVDQVLIDGFVLAALLLDLVGKFASVSRSDDTGVYTDDLAALRLVCSPLLDGRYILYALLQQLPVAVELLLGLVEVASVGGEGGLVVRDDCIASGASEATDVFWGVSMGAMRQEVGV